MVHPHTKGGFVCLKPCYHHHLALESRVFKAEFLGVFSPVWIHCPTLLTALQFLTLRDFFFLSILLFPYLFFEVSIPIWRSSLPWLPLLYWNYDSYSWGGQVGTGSQVAQSAFELLMLQRLTLNIWSLSSPSKYWDYCFLAPPNWGAVPKAKGMHGRQALFQLSYILSPCYFILYEVYNLHFV